MEIGRVKNKGVGKDKGKGKEKGKEKGNKGKGKREEGRNVRWAVFTLDPQTVTHR